MVMSISSTETSVGTGNRICNIKEKRVHKLRSLMGDSWLRIETPQKVKLRVLMEL